MARVRRRWQPPGNRGRQAKGPVRHPALAPPLTGERAPDAGMQGDMAGDIPGPQLVDPDVRARIDRHRIHPQHRGD